MEKRLHVPICLLKKPMHDEFLMMVKALPSVSALVQGLEGGFYPMAGERNHPPHLAGRSLSLNWEISCRRRSSRIWPSPLRPLG